MKVELVTDEKVSSPRILLLVREADEAALLLKDRIERATRMQLKGFSEGEVVLLSETEILRIYAEDKKVYCAAETGIYLMHQRLYELEEQLDRQRFVRISNSEIVNAGKIQKLDISFSGTIGVLLSDGTKTFASRRYVKVLKAYFGV